MTRSVWWRGVISWMLGSLSSGCYDDSQSDPCLGVGSVACDIRDPACQRGTFIVVACMRGADPGPTPAIRTIDADAFAAELRAALAGRDQRLAAALRLLDLEVA